MKCLRCGTIEMEVLSQGKGEEKYEVDVCSACGGVWMDASELKKMDDNFFVDMEEIEYKDVAPSDEDAQITCPRCEAHPTLNKVSPKGYDDVVLDKCTWCKGFWLDSGELKKVKEISTDILVATLFDDEE